MLLKMLATIAIAGIALAGAAEAKELKKIAEITIPGEPLTSFDICFVDQKTQRYYFADRSNKAIDIFDATANTYIA